MARPTKKQLKADGALSMAFDQKPLPVAPEVEQAVLGALIIDTDAFDLVVDILKPEYFYKAENQTIYRAIVEMKLQRAPVDILTLSDFLMKNHSDELETETSWQYYVASLAGIVSSSAHVEYHSRIVLQKYMARQAALVAIRTAQRSLDPSEDIADILNDSLSQMMDLNQSGTISHCAPIKDDIAALYKRVNDALNNPGDRLIGMETGFPSLDAITYGWNPGELIILAARPSMGKTAFALTMAHHMSKMGTPVAFFSLEMSRESLTNRLAAQVSKISSLDLLTGRLSPAQIKQFDLGITDLIEMPLYVDDTSGIDIMSLYSIARKLVKEKGVKIIMVDYLQLITVSGKFNTRQEAVAVVSSSLKALSKELKVPVIALSQLNRNVESRTGDNKRPQLSDLRESGSIEQDADVVCFIHRPEYYQIYSDEEGNDMRGIAEIIIAKNRNGKIGTARLKFTAELAEFSDLKDNSGTSTTTPF